MENVQDSNAKVFNAPNEILTFDINLKMEKILGDLVLETFYSKTVSRTDADCCLEFCLRVFFNWAGQIGWVVPCVFGSLAVPNSVTRFIPFKNSQTTIVC